MTLYKFSVWDTSASYGARLQGLRYASSNQGRLSTRVLLLHGGLTMLVPYFHNRLRAHALSQAWPDAPASDRRRKAWDMLTRLESIHSLLSLLNFVAFLWNGRSRTLSDRLLGLQLVSARRLSQREVSYEFMNRQMVWHAFTEFLLFLLPLINTRAIRRSLKIVSSATLSSLIPTPMQSAMGFASQLDPKSGKTRGKYWSLPLDQCAICHEDAALKLNLADASSALTSLSSQSYSSSSVDPPSHTEGTETEPPAQPLNTPYITSCDHVYCYVCITERMVRTADDRSGVGPGGTRWECLRCGEGVFGVDRVEMAMEETDSDFGSSSLNGVDFEGYGSDDLEFTDMNYLTKQIFIEKNVVTYRSLSRAFSIHVNEAKNALATFLAAPHPTPEQPYATYLISGEQPAPVKPQYSNGTQDSTGAGNDTMEVDSEVQEEEDMIERSDIVPTITMVLVAQQELESAKARFTRIHAEHVYCLSPSPLHDAGLICTPSAQTYEADAKVSAEASTLLGRIVGPHVQIGKVVPVASSSKSKPELLQRADSKKGSSTPEPRFKLKEKEKAPEPVKKEEDVPAAKPAKGSGKLDWSKAKPKGAKETKTKAAEEKPKVKEEGMDVDLAEDTKKKLSVTKGKEPAKKAASKTPPAESDDEKQRRGTKRKSTVEAETASESESKAMPKAAIKPTGGTKRKAVRDSDADSDDDGASRRNSPPPPAKPRARKAIISDDEEEEAASKPKAKGKAASKNTSSKSQEEVLPSLKAMWDDDDDVVQGSSRTAAKAEASEPEEDSQPTTEALDEDVQMEIDDVPKAAPKKRKQKKVVPVGSNGLKKKRVVKQKTFMDDNGYMVTEDYSEYESVDEEEPEPPKPKKGSKAKKSPESSEDTKAAKATLKEPRKTANKSSDSAAPKKKLAAKGSIQNFFNKK
ncbi:peroxisome assembly protein (Peroxin-2) [Steccherinum ochraceum]|uniref:DNA polymerase delta subunit 3 n=1 Tax=Steccherinum ochraceum TaxID=92696 RepID=A0A4R0RBN9_9APHY|nr:peroxisome assembly protein (Peroxin-2) [Steccherinum ochraceum]